MKLASFICMPMLLGAYLLGFRAEEWLSRGADLLSSVLLLGLIVCVLLVVIQFGSNVLATPPGNGKRASSPPER